MSEDAVET